MLLIGNEMVRLSRESGGIVLITMFLAGCMYTLRCVLPSFYEGLLATVHRRYLRIALLGCRRLQKILTCATTFICPCRRR